MVSVYADDNVDLPVDKPIRGRALLPENPEPDPKSFPVSQPPQRYNEPLRPPPSPEREKPLPEEVDYFGEKIFGKRFVYLIDKSGSMGRDYSKTLSRYQKVISETKRSIDELSEKQMFDIVLWAGLRSADGSRVRRGQKQNVVPDRDVMWGRLRNATADAKAEAFAWLDAQSYGGGTLTGLHTAWALKHYQRWKVSSFLLLSDGMPRDDKTALALILKTRKDERIDTFGIGLDARRARPFMNEVAAKTGGKFKEIE